MLSFDLSFETFNGLLVEIRENGVIHLKLYGKIVHAIPCYFVID